LFCFVLKDGESRIINRTSKNTEDINGILDTTNIQYYHDEIIGQGSTSIIYRGKYGSFPAAVKRVESSLVDVYENELKLWKEMKNTCEQDNLNIVTFYDWAHNIKGADGELKHYFCMELAKCDLGKRIAAINKNAELSSMLDQIKQEKENILGFIHDAAKGLTWMHNSGIIHRDIKPENIFIFEKASGMEMAKIGDFGISKKMSGNATGTNSIGRGSTDWMAPEALMAIRDQKPFYGTKAIDIFSLGLTAHFAMSLGIHPFGESKKYGAFINMNIMDENMQPLKLKGSDYAANHLLQWMMQKKTSDRPKVHQVLKHPLFWTWKESLEFIVDVSNCLNDRTNSDLMEMRKRIDDSYKALMLSREETCDWKVKMGSDCRLFTLLQKRKSNGKKKYDTSSAMKLVELIRDKYVHFQDAVADLVTDEFFGESGMFSEKQYANFFLKVYPEIVVFLFCLLVIEGTPSIGTLRSKYFNEFEDVPLLCT